MNKQFHESDIARTSCEDIKKTSIVHELLGDGELDSSASTRHNILRTLIDNMPDYIYVKDTQSRFIIANIAVTRGMGAEVPDGLIGKTDFDFYSPELAARYYADEQKIFKNGSPLVNREEPVPDQEGNMRWFISTKVPLHDDQGNIIGLVGIGRDITQRKRSEEKIGMLNNELESKNKELESILYAASHDLRSPLVNIQGFSKELSISCKTIRSILDCPEDYRSSKAQIDTLLNDDIPESLGYITTSATKMDSLLSGLLKLSRLDRAQINIEPLDMNALMNNVMENVIYHAKEIGAKITVDNLPPCLGDALQINQVFSNILDNALKYLDDSRQGRIHIYCKSQATQNIYCIEDNGIGIAPEHQDRIFGIFHRLDTVAKKGEGLGLTIVKHIINKHKGKVWAESEPGKGSRFFVSLPSV